MLMHDRDRQITLLIGQFGQLTSGQIKKLLFHDLASSTPTYRALERLTARKYLARIERRMVGGNGAGSGQYVYQLGSKGWELCKREGRYWPFRSVNYHTLAIGDAYVALRELERTGAIHIEGFMTEPDTWQTIGGAKLLPDMYIELAIQARHQNLSLWVEMDLGTERAKQIKDKLARYWHAFQHATTRDLEIFPAILFLAQDDDRVKELKWLIGRGNAEATSLFMVGKASEFPAFMLA